MTNSSFALHDLHENCIIRDGNRSSYVTNVVLRQAWEKKNEIPLKRLELGSMIINSHQHFHD
jgi:hypothetical protein